MLGSDFYSLFVCLGVTIRVSPGMLWVGGCLPDMLEKTGIDDDPRPPIANMIWRLKEPSPIWIFHSFSIQTLIQICPIDPLKNPFQLTCQNRIQDHVKHLIFMCIQLLEMANFLAPPCLGSLNRGTSTWVFLRSIPPFCMWLVISCVGSWQCLLWNRS